MPANQGTNEWFTQTTLYTIGLIVIIVIALQYASFVILRKMVKTEIGKVARVLLKNNKLNTNFTNNKQGNLNNNTLMHEVNTNDKDESLDIDTPTNIANEDIDSYVNPIPSIDNNDNNDDNKNNKEDD